MNLDGFPLFDQHAHNILRPEATGRYPFITAFTEAADPLILDQHARHTFFFRRSLRELADLLSCAPEEEAILAARAALGWEELTRRCFALAHLEALLLDDGFLSEAVLPISWHQQFVPVRRLLRIETLAQELLPGSRNFADFRDRFRAALDPPAPALAGFKSIIAYRSGLAIQSVSIDQVAARFEKLGGKQGGSPLRLTDQLLLDFLVAETLEIASRHRLPLQFHTGFGDPDLDLRLANPLHLRPLLEDPRYRDAPIVLLHASYPYAREAGYLAAVYPQVYLDMGLAVPFLSRAGMRAAVRQLLELAPASKLMYSSDAHLIPELFYLGAREGRAVLGTVLDEAIAAGDLTGQEAARYAERILAGNARALYRGGE